jgi:hypothetical protein
MKIGQILQTLKLETCIQTLCCLLKPNVFPQGRKGSLINVAYKTVNWVQQSENLGFRRSLVEAFDLPGCYAAEVGISQTANQRHVT